MTRTLVSAAIAAAALFGTAPAVAQNPNTFLVFIPYGDLDLATMAGGRTLDSRLRAAARQTCGDARARLQEIQMVRDCHARFRDAAKPRIEQAMADRAGRRTLLAASR